MYQPSSLQPMNQPSVGVLCRFYFILKYFVREINQDKKKSRVTLSYKVSLLFKIISENLTCKKTLLDGIQETEDKFHFKHELLGILYMKTLFATYFGTISLCSSCLNLCSS